MKKAHVEVILSTLNAINFSNEEILEALRAELTRNADRKQANLDAYEAVKDLIISNLSDTPVTCGELWDAIQNDVPDGITKGKVQYALTHLWQDEIVKIEGKPNTYRRA